MRESRTSKVRRRRRVLALGAFGALALSGCAPALHVLDADDQREHAGPRALHPHPYGYGGRGGLRADPSTPSSRATSRTACVRGNSVSRGAPADPTCSLRRVDGRFVTSTFPSP